MDIRWDVLQIFETTFFDQWVKHHLKRLLLQLYWSINYFQFVIIRTGSLELIPIGLDFQWLWAAQLKSHLPAFKNLLFLIFWDRGGATDANQTILQKWLSCVVETNKHNKIKTMYSKLILQVICLKRETKKIVFSLILWKSFWEILFASLCWNSVDSVFKFVSVAWQIKCSGNKTINFKYLEKQNLKRTQSPLQLPDFNGFQAASWTFLTLNLKSGRLGDIS